VLFWPAYIYDRRYIWLVFFTYYAQRVAQHTSNQGHAVKHMTHTEWCINTQYQEYSVRPIMQMKWWSIFKNPYCRLVFRSPNLVERHFNYFALWRLLEHLVNLWGALWFLSVGKYVSPPTCVIGWLLKCDLGSSEFPLVSFLC